MNTDKIREALESEYQYLLGAWQMATGPLIKADVDARIALNRDALAELDKAHQPGKALTDEHYRMIADRMIEEHRKYGDKLRPGHWADVAARKVASHLADFGYLAPAAGLTVDEVMKAIESVLSNGDWLDPVWGPNELRRMDNDLRSRLTAAINAKAAKR